MRLFLAVNPGEELRQELATRIDSVRGRYAGSGALRWTTPESWHLTLQFLGEWPEDRIGRLEQGIKPLASRGIFLLEPGTLGAFPRLDNPRVLFLHLGSDGNAERLAAAVQKTVGEIWPDGPQDRKPFRSHLTIARVKGHLSQEDRDALAALDLVGLPVTEANDFRLVASRMLSAGAEHKVLAVVPLGPRQSAETGRNSTF